MLPPVDRGDVPSALGVFDGVWWCEVCDIDAAALRTAIFASEGSLQEKLGDSSAPFPISVGSDGCPYWSCHSWYADGFVDFDEWGRCVRPSVARPERHDVWGSPVPGLVHLVVRFLPLRDVVRLAMLSMEWRQALPGLLVQRDRLFRLYGLAFEFVDPAAGVRHSSELSRAREAAVSAAASWDVDTEDGGSDADGDVLDVSERTWYPDDLGSRSSSPLPPDRAPAWLTGDYDLEDAMAAMELYGVH